MVELRANKRFADHLCPRHQLHLCPYHQLHLCLRHQLRLCPRSQLPDDENIDGLRNFGLPNFQPPDAAASLRKFYWLLCDA
jgi:hypothetical protein